MGVKSAAYSGGRLRMRTSATTAAAVATTDPETTTRPASLDRQDVREPRDHDVKEAVIREVVQDVRRALRRARRLEATRDVAQREVLGVVDAREELGDEEARRQERDPDPVEAREPRSAQRQRLDEAGERPAGRGSDPGSATGASRRVPRRLGGLRWRVHVTQAFTPPGSPGPSGDRAPTQASAARGRRCGTSTFAGGLPVHSTRFVRVPRIAGLAACLAAAFGVCAASGCNEERKAECDRFVAAMRPLAEGHADVSGGRRRPRRGVHDVAARRAAARLLE